LKIYVISTGEGDTYKLLDASDKPVGNSACYDILTREGLFALGQVMSLHSENQARQLWSKYELRR